VRLWGSDGPPSLRHYAFASSAEGASPIWNSVKLAALSGVIGTVVALAAAYVVERKRPPGRRAIEALSLLPAALPGTVIGVGYILAFNVPPLLLTGTVRILVTSVVFWRYPGVACALGTLILAIVIGSVLLLRALVGGDRVAVLKL